MESELTGETEVLREKQILVLLLFHHKSHKYSPVIAFRHHYFYNQSDNEFI